MLEENKDFLSYHRNLDVQAEEKNLFENTAGIDGSWGRPSQQELMEKRNAEFRRLDALKSQKDEDERRQREALAARSKAPAYVARTKWIQETNGARDFDIPYVKILAVFNNENLWLNFQDSAHALDMSFDLDLGLQAGWYPVVPKEIKGTVFPLFDPPTLTPSISEERVKELQDLLTDTTTAAITNVRDAANLRTSWANDEIGPVLLELLSARCEYHSFPKIMRNGWDPAVEDTIKWIKNSRGSWKYYSKLIQLPKSLKYCANLIIFFHVFTDFYKAREKLHRSVPFKYSYRLGFASLTSVDADDVSREISQKAIWIDPDLNTPMHLADYGGKAVFCVQVRISAYPGNINCCHVAFMAICPQQSASKDEGVPVAEQANGVDSETGETKSD